MSDEPRPGEKRIARPLRFHAGDCSVCGARVEVPVREVWDLQQGGTYGWVQFGTNAERHAAPCWDEMERRRKERAEHPLIDLWAR